MPSKLVNIKINEVSLVDKAANKKKFLIVKRAGDEGDGGVDDVLSEIAAITKAGRKISQSNLDRLKELHGNLGGLIDEHSVSEKGDPAADPDGEKNKTPQITKGEDAMDAVELKKMQDELADLKKANSTMLEQNQTLEKRLKDSEDLAKAEKDQRLEKEFIAKAQSYTGIGTDAIELGKAMKVLAEVAPDQLVKMEAALQAASEAVVKGALFTEIGGNGDRHADLKKRIDVKVQDLQKSDSKMTKEQALAKVLRDNPELYVEHLKEMKGAE